MYPTLPFGPISLPTTPIFALFSVVLMLDVAGRFARRVKVHPDDLWNTGLVALACGLIAARLWNVVQYWPIYRATPMLLISPRPSGFVLWPGVTAALIAGYGYLLYRALDPRRVAAAASVGLLAGAALLAVSGHMTGAVLGLPSTAPWALPYFGEYRHPAGLYRALGLLLACMLVWIGADLARPGRVVWQSIFAYSLVRLTTDGFIEGTAHLYGIRWTQIAALGIALLSAAVLAYTARNRPLHTSAKESALQSTRSECPSQHAIHGEDGEQTR